MRVTPDGSDNTSHESKHFGSGLMERVNGAFRTASAQLLHMPGPLFTAIIVGTFALALLLVGEGVQGLTHVLRDVQVRKARSQALSPWPYRESVDPALITRGQNVDVWLVLRIDSLSAGDEEPLCSSLLEIARMVSSHSNIGLRYFALSDHVPRCARAAPFEHAAFVTSSDEISLGVSTLAEPSVRWALVDTAGRVLYSRSQAPTVARVDQTLAVLLGQ